MKTDEKKKSQLTVPAFAILALLCTGSAGLLVQAQSAQGADGVVKIDNFTFGPKRITVTAGTTVVWTNRDDIPHTVVSDEKLFKSQALDTDDSFSFRFNKPGTYPYFCSLHPKMTGTVVVQ